MDAAEKLHKEAWSEPLGEGTVSQLLKARALAEPLLGKPYPGAPPAMRAKLLVRRLDLEVALVRDFLDGGPAEDLEVYCRRRKRNLEFCRIEVVDIATRIAIGIEDLARVRELLDRVEPLVKEAAAEPLLQAALERYNKANVRLEALPFVRTSTTYAVIEVGGRGDDRWCSALKVKRMLVEQGVAEERILISANSAKTSIANVRRAGEFERVIDAEKQCSSRRRGLARHGRRSTQELGHRARGSVRVSTWSNPVIAAQRKAAYEAKAPAAAAKANTLLNEGKIAEGYRAVAPFRHLADDEPEVATALAKVEQGCIVLARAKELPSTTTAEDLAFCSVPFKKAVELLKLVMLDCGCEDEFEARECRLRAKEAATKINTLPFLKVPLKDRLEVGRYDFERQRIEVSLPRRLERAEVGFHACKSRLRSPCDDYGTYGWQSSASNEIALMTSNKVSKGWKRYLSHAIEGAKEFKESLQTAQGYAYVKLKRHKVADTVDEQARRGQKRALKELTRLRKKRGLTRDERRELEVAWTCAKATRTTYQTAVVEVELVGLQIIVGNEAIVAIP